MEKPFIRPPDAIRYEEGDLSALRRAPVHFRCGVYLVCVRGSAVVSTGIQHYRIGEQSELIFLQGSLMQVVEASGDFRVRMVTFSRELFLEAVLPIDSPYLDYTHEHPGYRHTQDERSQKTWREILLWMDVAQMLFAEGGTQFRRQQELNFLQSLLMWVFNTIQEKIGGTQQYTRKQALSHQFVGLLREYATREHAVSFYADRMCISPRYLYEVTVECQGGRTPKQLIDEQRLAEVKVLLSDPHLSVTEIAEQLGFADQSYLTRFFRRHTGMSPKAFRAGIR